MLFPSHRKLEDVPKITRETRDKFGFSFFFLSSSPLLLSSSPLSIPPSRPHTFFVSHIFFLLILFQFITIFSFFVFCFTKVTREHLKITDSHIIFGSRNEPEMITVVFHPKSRSIFSTRMIIPEGTHCIVTESAKAVGVFKPGVYYRSFLYQVSHVVTTQCIFSFLFIFFCCYFNFHINFHIHFFVLFSLFLIILFLSFFTFF